MIFTCTNEKELKNKGLTLLGDLDLEIEPALLDMVKSDSRLVLLCENNVFTVHLRKGMGSEIADARIHLWIINEESYTDNLDDDTFTYFKYAASSEAGS